MERVVEFMLGIGRGYGMTDEVFVRKDFRLASILFVEGKEDVLV